MKFLVNPSKANGEVRIPASKSHTIRAIFFAALADGESVIRNPLESADTNSALCAVSSMGAEVDQQEDKWIIRGAGGKVSAPPLPLDVGNSGTTARFALSMASLGLAPIMITGDDQTRSRPMGPLLKALENLGARVISENGKLPATVEGPLNGGETMVDGSTSQYVSSLLIHTPLAPADTTIRLASLNEKPYVDMTLRWLDEMGVRYEREGYTLFHVPGRQTYHAFEKTVPADFSSATFFACLGAIPGNSVSLLGLDMDDSQGDKAVFGYLEKMGAKVTMDDDRITVTGDRLRGVELDLNATPDALPAMAALASLADGETVLGNTPQARIKETDRIAVMAEELGKMGVECEEKPDGLIVRGGRPKGGSVSGHGDHRVVMSLAVAGSASEERTEIDTAEAVKITFPTFDELFSACGGSISRG